MSAPKKRASLVPLVMVGAGILLMVVALLWVIDAAKKSSDRQAELAIPAASPRIPYPEVKRISLADAKAAFDLKQAIFIDARGEPYYSQGHIPGAISMAPEDVPGQSAQLDPNAWIITYCT